MSAFKKFRELFHYEVPDAEEIYDNPLSFDNIREAAVSGTKLKLEIDERQPTIVTHRMYWQGNEDRVPEALSVAVASSISHLTISNCNIALPDVRAIVLLCPSLETLEVRQIAATAQPIASLTTLAHAIESAPSALQSLTVTSSVPLETLFYDVAFPRIKSISLRLNGDGRWTTFDFLSQLGRSFTNFRLRGDIPPATEALIKRVVAERPHGFDFDFALAYEARGPN